MVNFYVGKRVNRVGNNITDHQLGKKYIIKQKFDVFIASKYMCSIIDLFTR